MSINNENKISARTSLSTQLRATLRRSLVTRVFDPYGLFLKGLLFPKAEISAQTSYIVRRHALPLPEICRGCSWQTVNWTNAVVTDSLSSSCIADEINHARQKSSSASSEILISRYRRLQMDLHVDILAVQFVRNLDHLSCASRLCRESGSQPLRSLPTLQLSRFSTLGFGPCP